MGLASLLPAARAAPRARAHPGDTRAFTCAGAHVGPGCLASGLEGVAMQAEQAIALHDGLGHGQLVRLAAYQRLGGALLLPAQVSELSFRIAVATALMSESS
jgi:hypothetical protein